MTASAPKTSRQAGRLEVLRKHERATWNVLQDHVNKCWSCQQFYRRKNPAIAACLEGRAAHEEWSIASRRHLEALDTAHSKEGTV